MSFELISELTRWTARAAMMLFALAFLYEALRKGTQLTRRLWQAYGAVQALYFICLISYHLVILQLPSFDILNGLLSLGTIMFCIILWFIWDKEPRENRLFIPLPVSYVLAFLFTALPISRILPPETDAPIYHLMLYAMCAVFILRIILDIRALWRRKSIG